MFVVKTGPEMTNKTFRLPVDLVQQLDEIARQKKISMNNLVLQCCQYALGEMGDSKAK